jgi:hypothetical protein
LDKTRRSLAPPFSQSPPSVAQELPTEICENMMAAKIKMLKLLQEMRGLAEVTNRRPVPRHPGLFLLQLRSHMMRRLGPQRNHIPIAGLNDGGVENPVKITFLGKTASVPPSLSPA